MAELLASEFLLNYPQWPCPRNDWFSSSARYSATQGKEEILILDLLFPQRWPWTCYLMGCDAVKSTRSSLMFRNKILPSSSSSNNNPSKKPDMFEAASCLIFGFLFDLEEKDSTFLRNVGKILPRLHGVTSQIIVALTQRERQTLLLDLEFSERWLWRVLS